MAPDFEEDTKKVLCKCVPFSQDNLREIIRSQRLKSVQQVLEIYGNGVGCEGSDEACCINRRDHPPPEAEALRARHGTTR